MTTLTEHDRKSPWTFGTKQGLRSTWRHGLRNLLALPTKGLSHSSNRPHGETGDMKQMAKIKEHESIPNDSAPVKIVTMSQMLKVKDQAY